MLPWNWSAARNAMLHDAAYGAAVPDDGDALGVPLTGPNGSPMFAVSASCAGSLARGEVALRPLREGPPQPAQDMVAPISTSPMPSSSC